MAQRKLVLVAKQGASSEAPENTLAAFRKAIDLGVDYFHLDVRLSRDGVPMVLHDSTLERTTNIDSPTPVSALTAAELKALDAGSWFSPDYSGEPIPTLEEVLLLPRKLCGVVIEIKATSHPPEEIAQAVSTIIHKTNQEASGPVIVASFSPEVLTHITRANPQQLIIGLVDDHKEIASFSSINHLGLEETLLSPAVIRNLQASKYRLWAFTVNDIKRATTLRAANIEGIITNNPRELINIS